MKPGLVRIVLFGAAVVGLARPLSAETPSGPSPYVAIPDDIVEGAIWIFNDQNGTLIRCEAQGTDNAPKCSPPALITTAHCTARDAQGRPPLDCILNGEIP